MLRIIGISPHPPLIIPEVGGEELSRVNSTVKGLQYLAGQVTELGPRCLVLITPHGPVLREGIATPVGETLTGHFGRFGAPGAKVAFSIDQQLLLLTERETTGEAVRLFPTARGLSGSAGSWTMGRRSRYITCNRPAFSSRNAPDH